MKFWPAIVSIAFLILTVIILIVKNRNLKLKLQANKIPDSGEVRKGKIFVSLEDPLYETVNASTPVASIKQCISHNFEADLDIPIGVRYHAISRNGRFLIKVDEKLLWVEPFDCYPSYTITISRK